MHLWVRALFLCAEIAFSGAGAGERLSVR